MILFYGTYMDFLQIVQPFSFRIDITALAYQYIVILIIAQRRVTVYPTWYTVVHRLYIFFLRLWNSGH